MAAKIDPKNPGTYMASWSKRHPITRKPMSMARRGFKSLSEAKRAERELIVLINERLKRSTTLTWREILVKHFADRLNRGQSKRSLNASQATIEKHTLECWGNRLITDISTTEIRELVQQKIGENAPSHQDYFLRGVRGVFNYAVESNLLDRNPTPAMKIKLGNKIQPVLTEEQARILLQEARRQNWPWYPHYALALYTGMRNGELFALTWNKVDFDRKTILVNQSWNSHDGFKSTKTADDRLVEISPGLFPLLQELKLHPMDDYVLPRLNRWQSGEQARELGVFLAALKLPVVRFHDLRATWATILLSKGVAPIKVMKMGGWKDLETMMIYARKSGVDIRGATDCLNFEPGVENVLEIARGSSM